MFKLVYTNEFEKWLKNISDATAKAKLIRRLEKVADGNFGDVKPAKDGVWEMREHFGAGYRMYYIRHGNIVLVMLGGGTKRNQQKDIDKAVAISKTLEFDDD